MTGDQQKREGPAGPFAVASVIVTPRLKLHPMSVAEADGITRYIGDLDVARWLTSVPHPYTRDDALRFTTSLKPDDLAYAIHGPTGFMGGVTIINQLGYWLGKPFWGQGYMTEAASALVTAYFKRGADLLTSGYLLGNAGSARVLHKLGFQNTEIIQSYVPSTGQTVGNQQMALSRTDWEARV